MLILLITYLHTSHETSNSRGFAEGIADIMETLFPPVSVKDVLNGVLSSSNSNISSDMALF